MNNRSLNLLSSALIAWFLFLRKRYINNESLVDPFVDELLIKTAQCNSNIKHDVSLLLSINFIFTENLANNVKLILENQYKIMSSLLDKDKDKDKDNKGDFYFTHYGL